MSSWLSTLAGDVKRDGIVKQYCENRVFVGNDINLIDTAYSETEDKKVSMFFVPGDTSVIEPAPGLQYNVRRFYVYLFIPCENDLDGIPAWELATETLCHSIENYVSVYAPNCSYVGSRTYRQGRGYYIYVYEFESLLNSSVGGSLKEYINLFRYTGESNGEAQYYLHRNMYGVVDDSRATNTSVNGKDNNFMIKIYVDYNVTAYNNMNQKSFVIVGGYNDNPPYASKKDAKESGEKVYEVVSWRSIPVGLQKDVLMELTCVCNV